MLAAIAAVPVGLFAVQAVPQTPPRPTGLKPAAPGPATPADPMLARFARLSPANISDAMDQVGGGRGFLDHDVRPYVAGSFVGRAATSLVRAVPADQSTPATAAKHSVDMIDGSEPGDVGVLVMEGSLDVAAMGGLMGTAAKVRGMAGMVIDGAFRDVQEIRALGLPVYARAISPANAVGRFASVASQIPVTCAGVTINPGDIIVASEEGVVAIPRTKADVVLKRAEEIALREQRMLPLIRKHKSVGEAIKAYNWI
jgi:regulator of RNase E activity RraA